ncbi:hypothetical protein [Cellulomonas marina]|uniref:hypothetical protein n=1 Tax=Cellulomonas marina TaxID=988821 RepID=UPI0011140614|nr:hypothetical protein [Cellulomonas marina]
MLTEPGTQPSPFGLTLVGAVIQGSFNLANRRVAHPVRLHGCIFSDSITIEGARFDGDLHLRQSRLLAQNGHPFALLAEAVEVAGSLRLDNIFVHRGALLLGYSEISGQLALNDAAIWGSSDEGVAVDLQGSRVQDGFFMRKTTLVGGALRIQEAHFSRAADFSGSWINSRGDATAAIIGDGLKVDGHLVASDLRSEHGPVDLTGVECSRQVRLDRMIVNGPEDQAFSVALDRARVGGDLDLTGIRGMGSVTAESCRVEGKALFNSIALAHGSISVSGGRFAGTLEAQKVSLPKGHLDASYAHVGPTLAIGGDLHQNLAGDSVDARHIDVIGRVVLSSLKSSGAVQFGRAKIGALLQAEDLHLGKGGAGGPSMDMEQASIVGGAYFGASCNLTGPLRARNASIGALMQFSPWTRFGAGPNGVAIECSGLRLQGDFAARHIVCEGGLVADGARLDGDFDLQGATIGLVGSESRQGIRIEGAAIEGSILLAACRVIWGALRLTATRVGGQISGDSETIIKAADNSDLSILLNRCVVGGGIFFSGLRAEGGTSDLGHAEVMGPMHLEGGHYGRLLLDGCVAGGDVLLNEVRCLEGLSLRAMRVEGSIVLRDAKIWSRNENDDAVSADRCHVQGDLDLSGLRTAGERVSLRESVVVGSVAFVSVTTVWRSPAKESLDPAWRNFGTGDGIALGMVDFRHGSAKTLIFDSELAAPGGAPYAIDLTGVSTQDVFGFLMRDWNSAINFIRSTQQPNGALEVSETFARLFTSGGRPEQARRLLEVSEARRRGRSLWAVVLRVTTGFGHYPFRAALLTVLLLALMSGVAFVGRSHFVPTNVITSAVDAGAADPVLVAGQTPIVSSERCSDSYPCFNAFFYAVDATVPAIGGRQAEYWRIDDTTTGQRLQLIFGVARAVVLGLAAIVAGGVAGLLKRG